MTNATITHVVAYRDAGRGETHTLTFATLAEAEAEAAALRDMFTRNGHVWLIDAVTVSESPITPANPIATAVVTADRVLATKGVRVPRRGYTLTNELTGQVFPGLSENEAHDIIWPTPAPYRFRLVSPRGTASIYIK